MQFFLCAFAFLLILAAPFASFGAGSRGDDQRTVTSLLELRRDGVVMQNWDLSCGAAALTTLLQYQFGDTVTEREVATGLINRDVYIANPILVQLRQGFSLLDLKRYVDKRGYLGMGFGGMSLQDLERRAPVLIPVNITGYNHFVIFRGRLGDRVLLADPAWGNRTMTLARFERVWIDYLDLGRVGFVVAHKGSPAAHPPAQLAPRESDFVTLN